MALLGMQFDDGVSVPYIKRMVTGSSRTGTVTFEDGGGIAIVFGRYASSDTGLYFSIIQLISAGNAVVTNYGTLNLTVSASGNTVTITTPGTWGDITVMSFFKIT